MLWEDLRCEEFEEAVKLFWINLKKECAIRSDSKDASYRIYVEINSENSRISNKKEAN